MTSRQRPAAPSAGSEGASSELARKMNHDVILELVRLHQPISRVDLARISGLQNSTVSSIVEQLRTEGWIREGEALKTARGRRPTQITLNDKLAMLAADVHPGRARLGIVDINGVLLDQEDVPLPAEVEPGVARLAEALQAMQRKHPERIVTGAGVCLPGRVELETGLLVMAPNLRWQGFDIRAVLRERLGLQVELENDANACLLAELWFGHLDGISNAVLLAISEGLGGALLADGHLIAGRRGLAGEFGHICLDPSGPACECGRYGCWEVFASTRAALGYFRALAPEAAALSYRELCQAAEAGEAQARAALEQQGRAIGRGLRMVTAALAPQTILFAGEISYAWPILQPLVERGCREGLLAGQPPRLHCTGDGARAHLLGAAALVLQRHAGYYRSRSPVRASSASLRTR